ncbi:MAG: hypothetical protein ACYSTS_07195 [Planctomycetota bacterium]|jgi:hypothetical protein
MKQSKIKKGFLFSVIIFFILSLLLETTVRIIHFFHPLYEDKTSVWVDHPIFHHWHVPNVSDMSRAATGEYKVPVRTNSHGMPGREFSIAKPEGVYRIALLGDSFVEGFTTKEENSIAVLLEGLLSQSSTQKHEVLNFGCTTFSPSLEYYVLFNLAQKFQPDMVILLFHMTDVRDDWKYEKSKVLGPNGKALGINGTTEKSILYKTLEKSAFLRTVVQKTKALMKQRRLEGNQGFNLKESFYAMFKDLYSRSDLEAWDLSKSYLNRIKNWSDAAGVPFLLTVIPVGPQVESVVKDSKGSSVFPRDWQDLKSTKMQDVLQYWSHDNGVNYLDLLPYAKAFKKTNQNVPLFYPLDQHFTASGNRVAADAIYKKITKIKGQN